MVCNIYNTLYRQKLKYKITWTHSRSKHSHMIYFIITHEHDISDICNVHVIQSAECDTDHSLMWGRFKLCVHKKYCMPKVKILKNFNVNYWNKKMFVQA